MTSTHALTQTLSPPRAQRLVSAKHLKNGSIYLAALGLSLLIATVGVAAVALARTQTRTLNLQSDAARADLLARSAADLALRRLGQVPDWKAAHTPGQWVDLEGSDGSMSYMLGNPDGGGLIDSPAARITLHARGTSGQAVRRLAVELKPATGNLLDNPLLLADLPPWTPANGSFTLLRQAHATVGTYLASAPRPQSYHGPQQAVTAKIVRGKPLFFEFYARIPNGSTTIQGTLHIRSISLLLLTGNSYLGQQTPGVGSGWTRVAGTLTPTWSGSLDYARFYVETPGYTGPFDVAHPLLRPAYQIPPTLPGTWRYELP